MMKLVRRRFLHLLAGGAAMPVASRAQTYPAGPVLIIAGFAAGGGVDISAHLIAQRLSEQLGQLFRVENRPGGNSNIATEAVVRAPPDGYTLLLINPANAINAALYDKLNFNFIRDIAPVVGIIRLPLVMLVNRSVPAQTVPEFIAYAKTNPGRVNMASAGTGTPQHLSGELFKLMAGVDMVHVRYPGVPPALNDLADGKVHIIFASMPASIERIRAGEIRPLAVTTPSRSDVLPEVPTVGEFVPGYESSSWYGVGAPKSTPSAIIDTLNKEINAALSDRKIKAQFAELGGTVLAGTPSEFGKVIADETEKWARVVRFAGVSPE
jgi:tripartite-type tricarboxylate transporter receptor subunit TctC